MSKNPAAVTLGRLGGSVKSAAKKKSSAENGKLGGRPKKEKRQSTSREAKVSSVGIQQMTPETMREIINSLPQRKKRSTSREKRKG